jgi:predicted small metal-binding protein
MSKSIKCADVGVTGCSWSASAETKEELMTKIQAHAKVHGFNEVPPELLAKIDGAIKDQ